MKQHLSVLLLAMRSTIYWFLALCLALGVAEAVLFGLALSQAQGSEVIGLEQVFAQSRVALACGVFFVLLCVILSRIGCQFGGGKPGYTLQRLSVSERATVFWWAGNHGIWLFLFWMVQLAIALLLCRWYLSQMNLAEVSGQTVFLAFYRNSFLHSLLPLAESSRYWRNGILLGSLSLCTACYSYRQRRGEKGLAVVVLVAMLLVWFVQPMGSFGGDLLLSLFALGLAANAVAGLWKERNDERKLATPSAPRY